MAKDWGAARRGMMMAGDESVRIPSTGEGEV